MPPDVLVPAAWTPAPTPVKVRMQPQINYSEIQVPAPPQPPSPPTFARKAMERAMEASVRSAVEASKPGMLTPGQTIQIEIYSESASADLPDPSMNPSGEMGMMERSNNSNSTRSLTIEPMGTIAFGAKYGRVKVAGMTLEAAEQAIAEMLREQVPDVKVQITLPSNAMDLPTPGPMSTAP
jgi:protein involved in polysaccharide export with SLBB domain